MRLRYHRVELPLEHVFTIARGSRTTQVSLIVELEQAGERGYGEATEHAYYGVSIAEMMATLDGCRDTIESFRGDNPSELWERLCPRLPGQMFLLSAIDAAAHDLFNKMAGVRTFEKCGLDWKNVPRSSFTIGIDSTERMIEKMQARRHWPVFKIKLGTDHDVEIVERLRRQTSAVFRVDANCGWGPDETIRNAQAFTELGVEFIEQPLPAEAAEEDAIRVFHESALPIIADESCLVETDVARCVEKFHGINVKLSKCGGITPAVRMLREARDRGLSTMVGCMVESSVGISAAAQLLPLLDFADLDGAELLRGDAAQGVVVRNGEVLLPDRCGNGVELLQERPAIVG